MHTPAHWLHTDLLNLPSIGCDELEAMIAAQSVTTPRRTGRKRRERRNDRAGRTASAGVTDGAGSASSG
jgi:hypothetical protein